MYICILPNKSLTGFLVEMVIVFPLLFAHVQYTKTDTNRQKTLTNRATGKCHHSSKELYDSYHWYEWQAHQSIGVPFVNCISTRERCQSFCFIIFSYFLILSLWLPWMMILHTLLRGIEFQRALSVSVKTI